MARLEVRSGLVCLALAATACSAMAQEGPATAPAGQSTSQCSSFLGCFFGKPESGAPASAASAGTPVPVAEAKGPLPAPDEAKPEAATPKVAPRKVVKKIQPVVIAADDTEVARIRALAATLPRTRIDIVRPNSGKSADFALTVSLGDDAPRATARLFSEQLHIVAGPAIGSVRDLEGKVVSFGLAGPGRDTARKAFAALGISVKETPLDLDNALDGLATGDVQAVAMLGPRPVARFARLEAGRLHLLSWPEDKAAPEGSTVTVLPAASYPGLTKPGETIRAMAVEAVLSSSGGKPRTPAVTAFLTALSHHSAALKKRGFDLLEADLASRESRRVASAERR